MKYTEIRKTIHPKEPCVSGYHTMEAKMAGTRGLILIAVEIFVIPGFGIAGISGLILVFAGLLLSLLQPKNLQHLWQNWKVMTKQTLCKNLKRLIIA